MAIVACVVGLWLTAITTTAHARVEGDTIVLGAVLSFSGQYQTNGHNTLNGYDLAVDRINAEGGVTVDGEKYKLRIIYYDDESNRIRASALAEQLIKQDRVTFMLGPYGSTTTKAVVRVTEKYKIPMVAPEAAAKNIFVPRHNYVFGLLSTCEHYFEGLLNAAVKRLSSDPADLNLAIAVQNERFSLCWPAPILCTSSYVSPGTVSGKG